MKLFQSRKLYGANGTIVNNNHNNNGNINNNVNNIAFTDSQHLPDVDCNMSVIDADSDIDSVDSNENMSNSQINWSSEEDGTVSLSSLDDLEKRIERLTNQVLQKKNDLNYPDGRDIVLSNSNETISDFVTC